MAKRGYKLQEFIAHASNVNCLSIGKKSFRVLITGGEDHKVNLWGIGKANSIRSLSGHTSPVESVTFDSAEILVVAGASSGSIKLWDLEEAKIVRTLTGHRSSCTTVEFHPFGEFFASGSLDTNLKIWDIRKKGCIHTYKGHSRGINTIRFSPDGRWVVSGGEDNVVKIWDLTAGKLLHEFKFHEGQIRCIDFHPHEFLLATGSADRTVKFWDLETFELIGSAGPEATGVRSMIFHPDGRTLFCGLDESLKVFSWEPLRCHDAVEIGWSTLGDLSIHDGKLLGCSYHQSCVGVWVADVSLIGPYATGMRPKSNGHMNAKFNLSENESVQQENNIKSNTRFLATPHDYESKRTSSVNATGSSHGAQQRVGLVDSSKVLRLNSTATSNSSTPKKNPMVEVHTRTASRVTSRAVAAGPVVVPRNSPKVENAAGSRKDSTTVERILPSNILSKPTHSRKLSNVKGADRLALASEAGSLSGRSNGLGMDPNFLSRLTVKDETTETSESNQKNIRSVAEKFERSLSPEPTFTFRFPTYAETVQSEKETCSEIYVEMIQSGKETSSEKYAERLQPGKETSSAKYAERFQPGKETSSAKYAEMLQPIKETSSEKYAETLQSEASSGKYTETLQSEASSGKYAETLQAGKETSSEKYVKGVAVEPGRTRSLVESWERRERSTSTEPPTLSASPAVIPETDILLPKQKENLHISEDSTSADDEDVIGELMQNHVSLLSDLQSRLSKLQVVRHFWVRNDIMGGINAVGQFPDHSVQADVISVLLEKIDIVTLDLFPCLLPLLTGLLDSKIERHSSISLEMLLKLVRIFGPVIHSSMSASSSVGIDLQAEQRLDRCNKCFIQLQKIKQVLPSLIRRGGLLAKPALELNLALQDS